MGEQVHYSMPIERPDENRIYYIYIASLPG